MGFLSAIANLIGVGKEDRDYQEDRKYTKDNEMDSIMREVFIRLNNDEVQNNEAPVIVRDNFDTVPKDMLETAQGEFGRAATNPILCNGPFGEVTYLSKLLVDDGGSGKPVTFHRLGSVYGKLDVYEVVSYDGSFYDILYLDMYHLTKSEIAPKGYKLQQYVVNIRGITSKNPEFPYGQYEAVAEYTINRVGFSIYDPDIRNINIPAIEAIMARSRA